MYDGGTVTHRPRERNATPGARRHARRAQRARPGYEGTIPWYVGWDKYVTHGEATGDDLKASADPMIAIDGRYQNFQHMGDVEQSSGEKGAHRSWDSGEPYHAICIQEK
jgi:hypothetical protein